MGISDYIVLTLIVCVLVMFFRGKTTITLEDENKIEKFIIDKGKFKHTKKEKSGDNND